MNNCASVLAADLSYAISMVRGSFCTPDQAARTCGIPLPALQAALGESAVPRVPGRPVLATLKGWAPV